MDAMADMEEMMPEEPSAFSKYKWLVLLGAVLQQQGGRQFTAAGKRRRRHRRKRI